MKNKQAQSDMQPPLTGKGQFSKTLLFFCAVILVFATIIISTATKSVNIGQAGELPGFDFSSNVACINPECFDAYPEAFYTPDDFTDGLVTERPAVEDDGLAGYYTYRLTPELTEGTVYGLSGYSATYAQKVWVDGILLSSVGTPGKSLESTTPKSNYYTIYFTAGSGQTEIIIQRSGFVHANGGQLFPQYVGEQSLISELNDGIKFRGAVMVGSMLMASLFFFGIFLFFRQRRQFLYFPLSCLLITIRTLCVDHKLIMTLFPNLNWQLSLRLEYLATISFYIFFFMYVNLMFKRGMNKTVNICGLIFGCSYFVFVLLTPAVIYTQFLSYMQYGALIYVFTTVFLLARGMVKDKENRLPEHFLILFGIIGYTALQLIEFIRYSVNNLHQDLNLTQMGVMVFVFANTLALALNFTYTEKSLAEARQRERETEETTRLLAKDNAALDRVNQLKNDLIATISHEMRTPLTVMSNYAQLAAKAIQRGDYNDESLQRLGTIVREAKRLAELSSNFLHAFKEQASVRQKEPLSIGDLITHTAGVFKPIMDKKQNRQTLHLAADLPPVFGNTDELTQVLFNLLANADTHTKNGEIVISTEWRSESGEFAQISISDTGSGISPELLPHIFEKKRHDEKGTGYGLRICKEIIENHGGKITMENHQGKGAVVTFTVPFWKEER